MTKKPDPADFDWRFLGARIPTDLYDWLQGRAARDERAVAYIVRIALSEYRQKQEAACKSTR
jgi:hypothetical protein